MEQTPIVLTGNKETDIHAVGRYIEAHIAEHGPRILDESASKLKDEFAEKGDTAYGTYLGLLLRVVRQQLKQTGLKASPGLPGNFNISREWGNQEETEQQRWMWSTIKTAEGQPLGTIVTVVFHDHSQFRIPRQPQIIALRESRREDVEEALSRRSSDFKQALPFQLEYAEYLRSLEAAGSKKQA